MIFLPLTSLPRRPYVKDCRGMPGVGYPDVRPVDLAAHGSLYRLPADRHHGLCHLVVSEDLPE